jgi:hypothetical protein
MEPAIPSKTSFQLSPKYDSSPFQNTGGCLQAVPVSLFRIIQRYSRDKDYRNLINSDLSFFQGVKYETARFPSRLLKKLFLLSKQLYNP